MGLCAWGVVAAAFRQILFGRAALFDESRRRNCVAFACAIEPRHLFSGETARVVSMLRLWLLAARFIIW